MNLLNFDLFDHYTIYFFYFIIFRLAWFFENPNKELLLCGIFFELYFVIITHYFLWIIILLQEQAEGWVKP